MPAAMPSFWNGCAGPTTGACISTSGRLAYTFLAVASAGPGARRSARGRGRGRGARQRPRRRAGGAPCRKRVLAAGTARLATSASPAVSTCAPAPLSGAPARRAYAQRIVQREPHLRRSADGLQRPEHHAVLCVRPRRGRLPAIGARPRRRFTQVADRRCQAQRMPSDPHPLSLRASMVAARCRGSQAPRRGLARRSSADSAAESAGCCYARCLHGAHSGPCLAAPAPPVHHTAGLVQVHSPPPGQPVGAPALARASSRALGGTCTTPLLADVNLEEVPQRGCRPGGCGDGGQGPVAAAGARGQAREHRDAHKQAPGHWCAFEGHSRSAAAATSASRSLHAR